MQAKCYFKSLKAYCENIKETPARKVSTEKKMKKLEGRKENPPFVQVLSRKNSVRESSI